MYGFQLLRQRQLYLVKRSRLSTTEDERLEFERFNMIAITAHLIIVPYLWFFGYETDSESIGKCHDSIAIQERECKDESVFGFLFDTSE